MSFIQFLRVLNRNLNLLLLCALALAVAVFFFSRNLPKSYVSVSEIYTGITSGMNVESVEGARNDYYAASNEYSNLINVITSKQTAIEVGERLLTQHLLLDGSTEYIIGDEGWENFNERVPKEVQDSLRVEGSPEETLRKVQEFRIAAYGSFRAKEIFESVYSPYSHKAISEVSVERMGNSDLIKLSYSWSDPGISMNTLELLNKSFSKRLLDMKVDRSEDVVTYFREKVEEARLDLENAEQNLVDFRIDNKILNYGEQASSVTASQKDIEEEYQKEMRVQAASRAKVNKLEEQLALNKNRMKFSDELLTKREKLASLNSRISELEVYGSDPGVIERTKREAQKLKAEISADMDEFNAFGRTKEGVSSENLLNEWLEATLVLDESTARLRVLAANKDHFENMYNEISPLGSQLGRLERAVDVAEKKYLELNNSLNSALMRQQSETIATSGITVTTPPTYPLEPVESKQLLLVLLAGVLGFIIPLVFVLLIEFLDNTVKSPLRGEELSGLKIMGAYPDLNPGSEFKNVDMDWLRNKAIGLISQNLRLDARRLEKSGVGPRYMLIFSTREKDGKSFLADLIARELAELKKKILVISPDFDLSGDGKVDVHHYTNDREFLEKKSLDQLMPERFQEEDYDFVILELRGILSNQYPIELVEKFDMAMCVLSAKRTWNKADRYAITEFTETLGFKPHLLVNGVSPDYMDQVLGDVVKTRSALRRFIKGILTMQFKNRSFKSVKESRNVTPTTS